MQHFSQTESQSNHSLPGASCPVVWDKRDGSQHMVWLGIKSSGNNVAELVFHGLCASSHAANVWNP